MQIFSYKSILLIIILICHWSFVTAAEQDALFVNTWILQSMHDKPIDVAQYPHERPNIKFEAANKYAAWAGCNRIAGSFALVSTDQLEFAPNVIMTKMACMGPNNIEDEFVAMLQQVKFWTIQENILIFRDALKVDIATFSKPLMP